MGDNKSPTTSLKGGMAMKKLLVVLGMLLSFGATAREDYSLLSQKQARCIARNVYFEANGTSPTDYKLVTSAVLTRAKLSGLTPCQVIYQPAQFSWVGKKRESAKATERINELIPDIYRYADMWSNNKIPDVTHFHNKKVKPVWAKKLIKVHDTGHHKYYIMK